VPEPTATASAPPTRSPGGRRLAAVLLTVAIGSFVGNAGRVVYRDTFTVPPTDPRDTDCATGLRRLHDAYERVWAESRGRTGATIDPSLDRALTSLRAVCAREGEAGNTAHRHLERWRYRAESMALLWRETLDDDVRAALAYQSPGSHR
jgi:hypothetical protein